MEIRKLISLFLAALISLFCYFYLKDRYNQRVVEYSFSGNLDETALVEIEQKLPNNSININLKGRLGNDNLVMTTGKDLFVKDIEVLKGDFFVEQSTNSIVIGDMVADRYFNTLDAVNMELVIGNDTYFVKGIIANDDNIYLPFSDDLKMIRWEKESAQYLPEDNPDTNRLIQDFGGYLKSYGLKVDDIVIYKNKVTLYLDITLILLLYVLIFYLIKVIKKLKGKTVVILDGYRDMRRKLQWYEYLAREKAALLGGLKYLLFGAGIIASIYFLLSQLSIPQSLIPENLFSLPDYMDILKSCYNTFLYHLENGFTNISVDSLIMNIIIASSCFVILMLNKTKQHKKENKAC